jgi:hypothetical protein
VCVRPRPTMFGAFLIEDAIGLSRLAAPAFSTREPHYVEARSE